MSVPVSLNFDFKGTCPVFTKFDMNGISLQSTQTYFSRFCGQKRFGKKKFLLLLNERVEIPSVMRQTETKLLFVGQILPRHFA